MFSILLSKPVCQKKLPWVHDKGHFTTTQTEILI